jgi:hypothetical protein
VNLTILKWIATAMLITGATTTSMNVYPLNIVLNTLGGILWTTAGVLMKDKPLITVNAVLTLIYGIGALYAVYI